MIRLMVGLGNPGPEYADTRHNAGFWWVDDAARQLRATPVFDRNYHGLVVRATGPAGPVWLLQPLTYMNLSGKSVSALARFFKIEPLQILVVHDELDLPPGQMKLKLGGSAAGHNGLKDIQAQLGSADFWRLRLGIGHPGARAEVANWVLRKPPLEDRIAIDQCISQSMAALPLLMEGPMDRAMMKLHAKPARPKPPRPAGLDGDIARAARNAVLTPAAAAPEPDAAAGSNKPDQ
jgi:PTH1 family peptidyl-tRNA hydrolase